MAKTSDKSTSLELTTPVQFVKGCGAARAELLARLGISTARDLLFFFPRDYQDLTDLRTIEQLEEGPLVSVLGTVEDIELRETGRGRSVLGVLLRQGKSYFRVLWFNQPFLREKYRRGQTLLVSGKAKRKVTRWEMVHPHVQVVDTEDAPLPSPHASEVGDGQRRGALAGEPREQTVPSLSSNQLLPLYPLTEGLNQRHIRQLMRQALAGCVDQLEEVFPPSFLGQKHLWPILQALPELHFPASRENLEQARRRFVYQELLVLQLALALKRQQTHDALQALPLELTAKIDARIRRLFPFPLTLGQNQAVAEIAADMARAHPMNRLLQGDVGSGKTIVAVYAMLLAVAHGSQVVLMAPTEVLARQHVETLDRLLAGSHTRLGLLTGGQSGKVRQDLLARIGSGEIQIVIGTQAVVAADVTFQRLGLVVIDEQHKFGVRQRAALKNSTVHPHYLVMTATPIPRTVAMTLFGDLDVTTLADSPPGRQNVHTYLPPVEERARWWEFYRKKLREGRQGYVVVPLVANTPSDGDSLLAAEFAEAAAEASGVDEEPAGEPSRVETASLEATYEALANGELEAFRIGLIHGRMSPAEKHATMSAFRRAEIQVLVATSVVEVGVDVPNATLMTIEGAERFGLAQLHQLRGRVSRGSFPGYCCLFANAETDEAVERLKAFVSSTDGFRLAELDFELRGPGDLLGTRQHGLPPLRIADLVRDAATVAEAQLDARQLVEADPQLAQPELALLRRMALVRYGKSLDLADVG